MSFSHRRTVEQRTANICATGWSVAGRIDVGGPSLLD